MARRLLMVLGLVLPALLSQTAAAAEQLPPASQWIPQEAVAVLELSNPKALLDLASDGKLTEAVTTQPAYQQLASQPGFKQFQAILVYLETRLQCDWKTGLGKLLGGGVTFAACPDGNVLLIVDAEDEKMLRELHEILLGFARNEAAKQGDPDRVVTKEYQGVTGWTFNGDEVHAIVGKRLVLANKPEALKTALDLRAQPNAKSLASLPEYQAARKAIAAEAAAMVFVNLKALKQHPPVQQALQQNPNPLAALLFAGVTEALRQSNWLAMELQVSGKTLTLKAAVDGTVADPSASAAFALPSQAGQGALPNLSVPRRIAALSFYRDLHGFYAAKDDLFPERTSGLIFFENMMGIFFSGLDLTEEVLGETLPEVRFVVAEQAYDPAVGVPQLKIPAFAAIFRLRDPEKFGEVMEEAWQKAIGLVNFTRGQQAEPGLIIDRPTHADTTFTVAYFRSPKDEKTNIDSRFNFRPALARLGDYLVLSSTDALARDLIDALKKQTSDAVKALAETHSLVEFDVVQLSSILGANRENLIRQNMLEDGNTRQQAETQTDLIVTVLNYLGRAKLDFTAGDGQSRASLELELNLP